MRIIINYHERAPVTGALGPIVEIAVLKADSVPHVQELVTYHPGEEPGGALVGRVTGVQHVYINGEATACVITALLDG